MATLDWFRDMATNNAWANERLYATCAQLTPDELTATRTSFFPSILKTLAHIAIVDDYYLDGLEQGGRGRAVFEGEPALVASFEKTRLLQRDADTRLLAFVAAADDTMLERRIGLERRTGIEMDRAGDILLHLMLHQVHHRGQVHAMLSGTRLPPPPLDEFFLHGDRPLALAELKKARGPH
jgi:uncharacterized damage-inducible protein DinB